MPDWTRAPVPTPRAPESSGVFWRSGGARLRLLASRRRPPPPWTAASWATGGLAACLGRPLRRLLALPGTLCSVSAFSLPESARASRGRRSFRSGPSPGLQAAFPCSLLCPAPRFVGAGWASCACACVRLLLCLLSPLCTFSRFPLLAQPTRLSASLNAPLLFSGATRTTAGASTEVEALAVWTESMPLPSRERPRVLAPGCRVQAAASEAPGLPAAVPSWAGVGPRAELCVYGRTPGWTLQTESECSWVSRVLGLQTSELGDCSGVPTPICAYVPCIPNPLPSMSRAAAQFRVLRRGSPPAPRRAAGPRWNAAGVGAVRGGTGARGDAVTAERGAHGRRLGLRAPRGGGL